MTDATTGLSELRKAVAFSKPRLRDFHLTQPAPGAVLRMLRARRLFSQTRRRVASAGFGVAGRELVAVPARDLAGVEVDCERVGLRWRLAPADLAQRSMFALGAFDETLVAWMLSMLRPGDRVVDVGAHVGLLSLQFAHQLEALGDGSVVSFEPSPDSAARLREHVAMNNLTHRVTVVEAAAGAESGVVTLRSVENSSADDPSLRSLHGTGDAVATGITLMRFDDWWTSAGRPPVDVVKIDVEGAELDVVEGMPEMLMNAQPRLLVVEIKEHLAAKAGVGTGQVSSRLSELGYERLGPFSSVVGLPPIPHLDENVIFKRKAR